MAKTALTSQNVVRRMNKVAKITVALLSVSFVMSIHAQDFDRTCEITGANIPDAQAKIAFEKTQKKLYFRNKNGYKSIKLDLDGDTFFNQILNNAGKGVWGDGTAWDSYADESQMLRVQEFHDKQNTLIITLRGAAQITISAHCL